MTSHKHLSQMVIFSLGTATGIVLLYWYHRYKSRKDECSVLEKIREEMMRQAASVGVYRRSASAEESTPEHQTRQRHLRRLWSTSGSRIQEEVPVAQVTDGQNIETQAIMNLLYYIGEDQARKNGYVHRGITCNVCQQSPLCGVRFKCANCPDYDVCDRCEPKDIHNTTHVFIKIGTPLPPLASPRTVLGKVLYPGRMNNFNALTIDETLAYTKITYFDQYEVEALHEEYRNLARSERGISQEVFDICAGPLAIQGSLVLHRLFRFYDQGDDKFIDFDEMIKGMNILIKSTSEERLIYAFQGYDYENKGSVSRDNMRRMFKAYFDITIELVRDMVKTCEEEMLNNFDDNSGRPVSSVFSAPIPALSSPIPTESSNNNQMKSSIPENPGNSGKDSTWPIMEAMSQDAIDEMIDNIFEQADLTGEDRMKFDVFKELSVNNQELFAWFDALGTVF